MTKIETIRRPRNVIERLLDGIERVSAVREHIADATDRRHIGRAMDEAKTAAGENDADRIMRTVRILEAIATRFGQPKAKDSAFAWPMFIEPKTLPAAGHIGLALIADGFSMKGQNVEVKSEAGNYLVDQYVRDEDSVHVKVPPAPEHRLVQLF